LLICTGFGNVIPTGAAILGIKVSVKWRGETSDVKDVLVRLTKDAATAVGANKGLDTSQTTYAYRDYGGAGDVWAAAISAADVNEFNFGVILQYENTDTSDRLIEVDHVRMTVYY